MQCTRQDPSQSGSQSGFTLLEMLVVMVLLSVIMLAMVSALRSAGQSGERVDNRLALQDNDRLAERFVQGALGRISERPVPGGVAPVPMAGNGAALSGKPPLMFAGAPDQISWVGVLPARYGAGGRSFFHLGVEPAGNTAALVMRYVPWEDQPAFPDWGSASAQVLMGGVTGLSVQYENDRPSNLDAPVEWEQVWGHPDYLPARVVIDIQRGEQAPLQWVVPLWSLPASRPGGPGGNETVIGGTVR